MDPPGAENARLEQIKRSWQQKRQITDRLADVKTKVGIYSGKGGVGKTTVSVNLAVTLAKEGNKVGLLDVDIDCPNVTKVLGISDKPDYIDGQIIPAEKWGVKVNDQLLTTNPNIYAAGDICFAYKFTHTADALARIVLQNALFFGRSKSSA